MKREPTVWENIFANDTSDKGLISKVYKELTHLPSLYRIWTSWRRSFVSFTFLKMLVPTQHPGTKLAINTFTKLCKDIKVANSSWLGSVHAAIWNQSFDFHFFWNSGFKVYFLYKMGQLIPCCLYFNCEYGSECCMFQDNWPHTVVAPFSVSHAALLIPPFVSICCVHGSPDVQLMFWSFWKKKKKPPW